MYVVDASVWVARFVLTDAHHQASQVWLRAQVDQGEALVSPALLLPELAGAVARRTGSSDLAARAVALVQRLPNARLVSVDPSLAQLSAVMAGRLHLTGADAVYAALAQRLDVPLVTWDRAQHERARPGARCLTPEEALNKR